MITPRDFPTHPAQDRGYPPLPRELLSHNWYPAVQRCACGLSLRSAQLWTHHIATVAVDREARPRT